MNKADIKKLWQNKTLKIILLCVVALLLLLAVWKVFFKNGDSRTKSDYQPTERESRLSVVLSKIEGVDGTTVMIGEENGVPVSAVIVFSGTDGFLTRMRITQATANALSIDPNSVLVYPA